MLKYIGNQNQLREGFLRLFRKIQNKFQSLKTKKKLARKSDFFAALETPVVKAISQLDREIIAIQRSTRVLFPIFAKPHNRLRHKYRWYYNWHKNAYSTHIHSVIVALVTVVAIGGVYTSLPKSQASMLAVSQNEKPRIITHTITAES
ncbi:MAG: hypothetical protein WCO23_04800, partial [bacterium]